MSLKIYVPRDAAALAADAEKVAEAVLAEAKIRDIEVELIRNGSRGMLWLEPLVEIERDGIRHAARRIGDDQADRLGGRPGRLRRRGERQACAKAQRGKAGEGRERGAAGIRRHDGSDGK